LELDHQSSLVLEFNIEIIPSFDQSLYSEQPDGTMDRSGKSVAHGPGFPQIA
jgi:hypothetical protein